MNFLFKARNNNNSRASTNSPQRQRKRGGGGRWKLPPLRKSESAGGDGSINGTNSTLDLDRSSSSFKYPAEVGDDGSSATLKFPFLTSPGNDEYSNDDDDDDDDDDDNDAAAAPNNVSDDGKPNIISGTSSFHNAGDIPGSCVSNYRSASSPSSNPSGSTVFRDDTTTGGGRRGRNGSPSTPFNLMHRNNLFLRTSRKGKSGAGQLRLQQQRRGIFSSFHKSDGCLNYSHNLLDDDDDDDDVSLPGAALVKRNQASISRPLSTSKDEPKSMKFSKNNENSNRTARRKSEGCLTYSHTDFFDAKNASDDDYYDNDDDDDHHHHHVSPQLTTKHASCKDEQKSNEINSSNGSPAAKVKEPTARRKRDGCLGSPSTPSILRRNLLRSKDNKERAEQQQQRILSSFHKSDGCFSYSHNLLLDDDDDGGALPRNQAFLIPRNHSSKQNGQSRKKITKNENCTRGQEEESTARRKSEGCLTYCRAELLDVDDVDDASLPTEALLESSSLSPRHKGDGCSIISHTDHHLDGDQDDDVSLPTAALLKSHYGSHSSKDEPRCKKINYNYNYSNGSPATHLRKGLAAPQQNDESARSLDDILDNILTLERTEKPGSSYSTFHKSDSCLNYNKLSSSVPSTAGQYKKEQYFGRRNNSSRLKTSPGMDGFPVQTNRHRSKKNRSLDAEKKKITSTTSSYSSFHRSDGCLTYIHSTNSSSEKLTAIRRRNHLIVQGEDIDQRLERRLRKNQSIKNNNDEEQEPVKHRNADFEPPIAPTPKEGSSVTDDTKQRSRSADYRPRIPLSIKGKSSLTGITVQRSHSVSPSSSPSAPPTLVPTFPRFRRGKKSSSLPLLTSRAESSINSLLGAGADSTNIEVKQGPTDTVEGAVSARSTAVTTVRCAKSTEDLKDDQKRGTTRIKTPATTSKEKRRYGLGNFERGNKSLLGVGADSTKIEVKPGPTDTVEGAVSVQRTATNSIRCAKSTGDLKEDQMRGTTRIKAPATTGKEKRRYGPGSLEREKQRRGRRPASRSFSPPRVITVVRPSRSVQEIELGRQVVKQALQIEETQQVKLELLEKGRPAEELDNCEIMKKAILRIRCKLAFKNDLAKIDELSLMRQHYEEKKRKIKEEMTKKYEEEAQKRSWQQLIIQKEIIELVNEKKDLEKEHEQISGMIEELSKENLMLELYGKKMKSLQLLIREIAAENTSWAATQREKLSTRLSDIQVATLFQNKDMLLSIFKFLETDGSGKIAREELKFGIDLLNKRLPPDAQFQDHHVLFETLGADSDGDIDLQEFNSLFSMNDGQA